MSDSARSGCPPVVIGHRGACGYRPEHTLGSYQLAIALGADHVEPDLVSTRDGVLVCRHENELSCTTDVGNHPRFAHRRTTKSVDGRAATGWFTEDFTLAELQELRAVERFATLRPANRRFDGKHHVPTFDELLHLVDLESHRRGRRIGICPELKHASHFESMGLPLEEPLLIDLRRHYFDRPNAEVLVQSFEVGVLRRLAPVTAVPLVQLIHSSGAPYDLARGGSGRNFADLISASGLREISTYAAGIGVHKELVIPRSEDGWALPPTSLVADAKAAGLDVYVWTLRSENLFLPMNDRSADGPTAHGDAAEEVRRFLDAAVTGVVSDFPDVAVSARAGWLAAQPAPVLV